MNDTRLLIGGERVGGAGTPLEVENPYSEETISVVPGASGEQLDAAVSARTRP